MYKCKSCGAVFDEPEIITATHGGRYEADGYENYGKCPNCPSDDFQECVICDECGEGVIEGFVYFSDKDKFVCADCLHDYCVENYSYKTKLNCKSFPEIVKTLRLKKNMSQFKLAQELRTVQTSISHYETGRQYPSLGCFIDLANYFGVSADYLLGG